MSTYEADSGQSSRFGQIMLNQGAVEQVLVDYLRNKNAHDDWKFFLIFAIDRQEM
jgi:hypothetical protein